MGHDDVLRACVGGNKSGLPGMWVRCKPPKVIQIYSFNFMTGCCIRPEHLVRCLPLHPKMSSDGCLFLARTKAKYEYSFFMKLKKLPYLARSKLLPCLLLPILLFAPSVFAGAHLYEKTTTPCSTSYQYSSH